MPSGSTQVGGVEHGDPGTHTREELDLDLVLPPAAAERKPPVPYVQAQVGHEDPTTTLQIYAQVLKRRDRQLHGEAFDALMTDVPSSASIIMRRESAQPEAPEMLKIPAGPGVFSNRNR